MKLAIGFWNIQKRTLDDRIVKIVKSNQLDIVVLAECQRPQDEFLSVLNSATNLNFSEATLNDSGKVRVFFNEDVVEVLDHWDSLMGDLTVKQISFNGKNLLLFGVHLPSELGSSKQAQVAWAVDTVRDLRRIENEIGHSKSIVIGDFNMTPYHFGITGSKSFAAVTCKKLAQKTFKYAGIASESFYNPMWNLLGDETLGPPGTRVYRGSGDRLKWHIIDQVLLRPKLVDSVREVKILDSDGETSLLNKQGNPNISTGSDHLPIALILDL